MFCFHYWINKLFSEGNKLPRTLFEGGKVAGSATQSFKRVCNGVVL